MHYNYRVWFSIPRVYNYLKKVQDGVMGMDIFARLYKIKLHTYAQENARQMARFSSLGDYLSIRMSTLQQSMCRCEKCSCRSKI